MPSTSIHKPKTRLQPSEIASAFILKSYQLLEDQKYTEIVDWNDEGTAIVIKMPVEFGKTVLPAYFKHGNITSFTRQLNMYSFRKRRNETYDLVYYHDLFQRGQKHLLKEIKRKTQQNTFGTIQKALSVLHSKQTEQQSETSTNDSEDNEMLKLATDAAMERITFLEKTVEDLILKNKALQHQADQKSRRESLLTSFMSTVIQKTGTTKEQLYESLEAQLKFQPLNLSDTVPSASLNFISGSNNPFVDMYTTTNVGNLLNLSSYTDSTKLPSYSTERNASSEFAGFGVEATRYEPNQWRLPSEQEIDEDKGIGRGSGIYDEEFECGQKMVKTERLLNVKRCSSSRDWFLDDKQETKGEGINNDTVGIYSGMNDFLRDGLGFLSFD